jgi:ubiquinone biosynthesis protein
LLLRLFQTARRFNMQVQPQLVLLQKTLLNIEGLGRQLYPELDLWQTAKPFLERWMSEQLGVRSLVKSLKDNSTFWTEKFPEMPQLLYEALKRNQPNQLMAGESPDSFELLRREIRRANQRTIRVVIGAVLLICAVVLLQGLSDYAPVKWANAPVLTWMLGGLGALILVFAWPSHKD